MKAGRELDLLIASEVMCEEMPGDYKQTRDGRWMKEEPVFDSDGTYSRAYYLVEWPPRYSTDIAAAWQVVEKLLEVLPYQDIHLEHLEWTGWAVGTCFDKSEGGWDDWVYADTAPLAICLAALEWARR